MVAGTESRIERTGRKVKDEKPRKKKVIGIIASKTNGRSQRDERRTYLVVCQILGPDNSIVGVGCLGAGQGDKGDSANVDGADKWHSLIANCSVDLSLLLDGLEMISVGDEVLCLRQVTVLDIPFRGTVLIS